MVVIHALQHDHVGPREGNDCRDSLGLRVATQDVAQQQAGAIAGKTRVEGGDPKRRVGGKRRGAEDQGGDQAVEVFNTPSARASA
jgi:hypothetical protein